VPDAQAGFRIPELPTGFRKNRGNAVLFEYVYGIGQVDEASVHAGNRVLGGEKWVLTEWMRQRRFVSKAGVASEGMLR
jgi:prolyl 4-hydroxylase